MSHMKTILWIAAAVVALIVWPELITIFAGDFQG